MPVLFASQEISGTPDLQIPHCDAETASQLRKFPDRRQTFFRHFAQHLIPAVHQKGVSSPAGSSDSSPELVKLGESHGISIMNDHRVCIGNIQSGLNNARRDQHIDITVNKIIHNAFQFSLLHLPVGKGDPGLRYQRTHSCCDIRDRIDTVIYIIDLPASCQFAGDRFPYQFLIVFHHKRLDRETVLRSFFQYAHVPDPDQTHVQGTRDRCGCERQHIHILFHLLDLFLMSHAEALLFIHDQQTELLEADIL